jgi:hypothetical protein
MSYGDGGFFFLQPVNNGYGALDFQPNPYGRIVDDKKFGRYATLRQRGQVRSEDKKAADIAQMEAHVQQLQANTARITAKVKASRKAWSKAKKKDRKKAKAAYMRAMQKQLMLRRALSRMAANIRVAKARGVQLVGGQLVGGQLVGGPLVGGPLVGGNGEVGDEHVLDPSDDATYAPAHEYPEDEYPEDEFDVDEVDPLEDDVDLLLDETGTPVVVEDTESFYQRNRTTVMLVAGGLGIYALLSIARR